MTAAVEHGRPRDQRRRRRERPAAWRSLHRPTRAATQETAAKALDELLDEGPGRRHRRPGVVEGRPRPRSTRSSTHESSPARRRPRPRRCRTTRDDGYFFRTIASDALQAKALGEVIAETGRHSDRHPLPPTTSTAAPVASSSPATLQAEDTTVTSIDDLRRHRYDALQRRGRRPRLVEADPASVAVIGLPDAGGRVIAALEAAGTSPTEPIFVTDGMRVPNLFDKVQQGHPRDAWRASRACRRRPSPEASLVRRRLRGAYARRRPEPVRRLRLRLHEPHRPRRPGRRHRRPQPSS